MDNPMAVFDKAVADSQNLAEAYAEIARMMKEAQAVARAAHGLATPPLDDKYVAMTYRKGPNAGVKVLVPEKHVQRFIGHEDFGPADDPYWSKPR
jgi:hypothetical protein